MKEVSSSGRSGRLSVLFRPQVTGWGLPTLGRIICFTQSANLHVNLMQKQHPRNTKNNVWPHIWAQSSWDIKLTIAACKSLPSLVLFVLSPLSGSSGLFWWIELHYRELSYREAHVVRSSQQPARERGPYLAQRPARNITILLRTTWGSREVKLSVKPWQDCSPGWHLALALWEILKLTTQLSYTWTLTIPGSTEIVR